MHKDKIRRLVKKYNLISIAWLNVFILFMIVADWLMLTSAIDRRFELGLDQVDTTEGSIWIAVVIGLNIVLYLFFYSLERILLNIHSQEAAK